MITLSKQLKQRWQLGTVAILSTCAVVLPQLPVRATPLGEPIQLTQAQMAQVQWPVFTSSTGRFAVELPQPPEMVTETDEIDGEPIEIYQFDSKTDTSSYTVVYSDLPASYLSKGAEVVLDEIRDYVLEDMADEAELNVALAASETGVQLGRYPGRQYQYSGGDFTVNMRLYLVGERMYLIAGADVEAAQLNQFVNSFELL
ncbi:MAG: hypothetical protein AAF152_06775 [Cyanobacteria bacterium P01_A01_bin.114]